MKFLENIKSSIYNPVYYKEILNKPFSYSLRYFFSLAVVIALVTTITFSLSILPKFNKFVNETAPKVLNYYPSNLEVTVKSGKVSTNVAEPYFIKIPTEFKSEIQNSNNNNSIKTSPDLTKIENLLVIDTKTPITIDLFNSYKTAALLSYDSFAYYDNGSMKIQPLDQTINGVVNKAKFSQMLVEIMPYLKISPLVLLPIIFIFSFFGLIFVKLIYLIFGAFVIWIMFKAIKKDLGYGKSYQFGLHALTLGVILEATVFYFYPNLEVTFLFTILMLAIVWLNFGVSSGASTPLPEQKTSQAN